MYPSCLRALGLSLGCGPAGLRLPAVTKLLLSASIDNPVFNKTLLSSQASVIDNEVEWMCPNIWLVFLQMGGYVSLDGLTTYRFKTDQAMNQLYPP